MAQFRGPGRLGPSYTEHDAIVQAILRGNGDQAYRATLAHGSSISRAFADYAATHAGLGTREAAE
ncbi:MAG TPA: FCD domain-containing protein [Stellaceae bacterium]|nr:FCD domain-containing protein [Stellaceae bacterium]